MELSIRMYKESHSLTVKNLPFFCDSQLKDIDIETYRKESLETKKKNNCM